jgi:hypothetical protein
LLIALPAVLWPLWHSVGKLFISRNAGTSRASRGLWPLALVVQFISAGVLILFLVVSSVGTVRTIGDIPAAEAFYSSQNALVNHLQDLGVTRFYSEYWTCNRLIFQSDEKLICVSLSDQLTPGFDRYLPYRTDVHAVAHPGYVFPASNPQVTALDAKIAKHQLDPAYRRQVFDGYVIYYGPA